MTSFVTPVPKKGTTSYRAMNLKRVLQELADGPLTAPELSARLGGLQLSTIYSYLRELAFDDSVHTSGTIRRPGCNAWGVNVYALGPAPAGHKITKKVKEKEKPPTAHSLTIAGMLGVTEEELENLK